MEYKKMPLLEVSQELKEAELALFRAKEDYEEKKNKFEEEMTKKFQNYSIRRNEFYGNIERIVCYPNHKHYTEIMPNGGAKMISEEEVKFWNFRAHCKTYGEAYCMNTFEAEEIELIEFKNFDNLWEDKDNPWKEIPEKTVEIEVVSAFKHCHNSNIVLVVPMKYPDNKVACKVYKESEYENRKFTNYQIKHTRKYVRSINLSDDKSKF